MLTRSSLVAAFIQSLFSFLYCRLSETYEVDLFDDLFPIG